MLKTLHIPPLPGHVM